MGDYWGGSLNATTHLLDAMHYRGLLRVARRESGVRIYTAHEHGLGPNGRNSGFRIRASMDWTGIGSPKRIRPAVHRRTGSVY